MCVSPKVPENRPFGNKKHSNPDCPFCAWTVVWKHMTYKRTGTHARAMKNPPDYELVQRCVCKNPVCKRTFNVLPQGILPYCRFRFEDFLALALEFQERKSAYSAWKSWPDSGLALRTFVRFFSLIKRALTFITTWARELDFATADSLRQLCQSILSRVSWPLFTTRWYHTFYPSRLWHDANPHNLAP